jgi:hypothetical protein
MKAFLEHFAAILGAATAALLAMSWTHEYGYFSTIGRQFQTFLAPADYIANGALWLPLAILFIQQTVQWSSLAVEPIEKGTKAEGMEKRWSLDHLVVLGRLHYFYGDVADRLRSSGRNNDYGRGYKHVECVEHAGGSASKQHEFTVDISILERQLCRCFRYCGCRGARVLNNILVGLVVQASALCSAFLIYLEESKRKVREVIAKSLHVPEPPVREE